MHRLVEYAAFNGGKKKTWDIFQQIFQSNLFAVSTYMDLKCDSIYPAILWQNMELASTKQLLAEAMLFKFPQKKMLSPLQQNMK